MRKANERDELILEHLGRYRISLRQILERLFFDGKNAGNVIQRMLKNDTVHSRSGLPNRIRYYQLSALSAGKRSIPKNRCEPFAAQALNVHLAVLWHCCATDNKRHRVEEKLLSKQFENYPRGPHCVEDTDDGHKLSHVRVCTPETEETNLIRRLREDVYDAYENKELIDPLRSGQYGYVVLVETKSRIKSIRRALEAHEFTKDADIQVDFAPSHQTLHQALKELK